MAENSHQILLVDDSKVNRLVAEARLKDAGFGVTSVENGRQALDLLVLPDPGGQSPPFDAVLLDIMMPEIDGIEVLRRTRRQWNPVQLPILMATAKDRPEDVVEALESGANDYVTKPLDLPVLVARLNTHLNIRHQHEALRKAQQSLMNASRSEATGLLAAGVAHEIRNPLAQIQMAATGFGTCIGKLPEGQRESAQFSLDTIESAVEAADAIVKKLMQASRTHQLNMVSVDLNRVLDYAIEMVSANTIEFGATLRRRFDPDLPKVLLAEDEFYQAFVAIVGNALQAMQVAASTPRELTIRTEATVMTGIGSNEGSRSGNRPRDGDQVAALYIEDTGPGMSKTDLESAFDAFYTTKATGTGTGLGLTVARKLIELHCGVIRLENRTDVASGLRVSIFLKTPRTFSATV